MKSNPRLVSVRTLHEYRYYNNVLFGDNYDSESGAHHIKAFSVNELVNKFPNIDTQSIQIKVNGKWIWVTDVSTDQGGLV